MGRPKAHYLIHAAILNESIMRLQSNGIVRSGNTQKEYYVSEGE